MPAKTEEEEALLASRAIDGIGASENGKLIARDTLSYPCRIALLNGF